MIGRPVLAAGLVLMQERASNALEPVLKMLAYAVAASLVWFAPALVILNNVSPLNAMAASVRAVARNWRVALVFAIAIVVDMWLTTFAPLLLRGLLVTPLVSALIVLSMYGAYRGIFDKS
jgi:uncharacterized membrane protein